MLLPGDANPAHSPAQGSPLDGASLPKREPAGFVISDLHLLSSRSTYELHSDLVERVIRESRVVVLNGDIFDFRWSRLGTIEESVEAAAGMLESALKLNPGCEIHYVLGNHDRHPGFISELERIAAVNPNLEVYPSHARIGTNLFLHGDLPDPDDRAGSHTERASAVRHLLYDVATALGAQKLAYLSYSKQEMAERILSYMEQVEPGSLSGVEDIYFGHTHVAFENYEYRGIRFHNTGAAVKGMEMSVLGFW